MGKSQSLRLNVCWKRRHKSKSKSYRFGNHSYRSTDNFFSIDSEWYRNGKNYEKFTLRYCAAQNKTAQFYVFFNLKYDERVFYQVDENISKEILEFDHRFLENVGGWKYPWTPKFVSTILIGVLMWICSVYIVGKGSEK